MAKIAFILLCHKEPETVVRQAERLTASGDGVAIHYDARAPAEDFARLRAALGGNARVAFAARRVKCGWGEWSLVRATLNTLEAAAAAFPDATHFCMISGDCAPVKSAAHAHAVLDAADRDHIESFDFFASDWIRTGLRRERLVYRHVFNERTHKRLFHASMDLQRRLRLERRIPADLQVMIGSQWWCLRRATVEAIMTFIAARPDVVRFFRTTWIPDETFFQTLVRHLVPDAEIENRSPTFKLFSDYGMPVTFHNDQYDFLLAQDHLFARKISPGATVLRERLGALWTSGRMDVAAGTEGAQLYRYLTGRGRGGRRFGARFWEREGTLGAERELVMIVCKKWQVGKRLMHAVEDTLGIPGAEYVFDDATCPLPDLGGTERTLEKRNRHRRAFLRLLYDRHGTDRMVICLDPENVGLIADFMSDRARTRLLEVHCAHDDRYLVGHARRAGLVTSATPQEVIARMLPTLRQEFEDHATRIREAGFPNHWRLREQASAAENAAVLSEVFDIGAETGHTLAETPHLFAD
ncbi:DUF5928 domain-containing protein [Roseibacterium sp. SDUM158017]|uniref:DUF5928 domain-containing protein n=1 Tax=Roseicyclus salinarum TaxID=3036773 RepID=UPI0024157663|nr:DUF5928 domain-containing protein [Roseibacterium sp. SDUM158017]MDG4649989.1 DUF5928 domain-containing protein [Roseibacterium sp. SDUM158017]